MAKQKQLISNLAFNIVYVFGGFFFGAVVWGMGGSIFGAIVGYLMASNALIKGRLEGLEKTLVAKATSPQPEPTKSFRPMDPDPSPSGKVYPRTESVVGGAAVRFAGTFEPSEEPVIEKAGKPVTKPVHPSDPVNAFSDNANQPVQIGKLFTTFKEFFTTGNVILKIGLIVLFFGVSFLLKYAAQRNLFPIELRLVAVTLGGMAMLFVGWRLRHRQMLYGLLLQGASVGILYLTIFAAAKLYHLLPFTLGFALMIGIVALSGVLAVLQNEKWLAITGTVGGFLAPVLLSTGGGSHVALFSYYLILNLGILGISWFKAWRELNLLGFIFTFVIGYLWGARYYHPAYFFSVEPFLLASFLLYVTVSILFALKHPIDLKGYIDPPLVFGVPIATFAFQYCLVRNFEHGLALSAVGFGLFYMLCAPLLWRRCATMMQMLVEIFLSFGVVFGSLAIPLALDGYWITAAWAMEGAALIWVGVRQARIRARVFGVLLQFGAGVSFLGSLSTATSQLPVINGLYISCLLLAAAGLFSSYYLTIREDKIQTWEKLFSGPLLVWGLCWWFGGGIREIDHFVPVADKSNVFLLFISGSFLAMSYWARKLPWQYLAFPQLLLLPVLVVLSLWPFAWSVPAHHFAGWGVLFWAVALASQFIVLHTFEKDWPPRLVALYHSITLWLILILLTRESAWAMEQLMGHGTWLFITWSLVPAAGILLLNGPGRRLDWPVCRFSDAYQHIGLTFVVLYLCVWSLMAIQQAGDPAPLPFFPLLNPLEVFQAVVLLVCFSWGWKNRNWLTQLSDRPLAEILYCPGAVILFLWLNAAVARIVHFYGQVPYDFTQMFQSVLFQAAISMLWGLTALALMSWSTRKVSRQMWMLGAGLLAMVVLKLFFVDLSGSGTVGRIVSFLGVGLLMLVIGYLSPLPPRQDVTT